MNVSAKAEYACLALIDMALQRDATPLVQTSELAKRNAIPERFLVQILLQLKGAGLVQSVRGASGGYRLSVDPRKINLLEVVRLVDGPSGFGAAESAAPPSVGRQVLQSVWRKVTDHEEQLLREISIADLAESAGKLDYPDMYYI
ncbi:MAG: Rrf2 family transcriptional regulator [Planctomycetes bacterium]|nr:Rrf2 family transcriptional regulator [Planctomycetota bacterium]